jgi:hypothetical protein
MCRDSAHPRMGLVNMSATTCYVRNYRNMIVHGSTCMGLEEVPLQIDVLGLLTNHGVLRVGCCVDFACTTCCGVRTACAIVHGHTHQSVQ